MWQGQAEPWQPALAAFLAIYARDLCTPLPFPLGSVLRTARPSTVEALTPICAASAALITCASPSTPAMNAPLPGLTPKLTVNCAGTPRAVERVAVTWYVAAAEPAGSVSSRNSRVPLVPTYYSVQYIDDIRRVAGTD